MIVWTAPSQTSTNIAVIRHRSLSHALAISLSIALCLSLSGCVRLRVSLFLSPLPLSCIMPSLSLHVTSLLCFPPQVFLLFHKSLFSVFCVVERCPLRPAWYWAYSGQYSFTCRLYIYGYRPYRVYTYILPVLTHWTRSLHVFGWITWIYEGFSNFKICD